MELPHAAIVGLGFMGRTHLQSLRRLGVQVNGILGITPEEGQKFSADYHVDRVYLDLDEILSDPEVSVVHICTPNDLHYPISKAALNAGKNVICEKPLALNSRETGELAELAKQKGLAAAVDYNLRFYPLCQEARARYQAGELGEARLIYGAYIQDWLFLPTDWNWRLEAEAGGSLRAVSDIGTHWMDMITWITGMEIVEVMADLATFIPTRYKPLHEVATFDGKLTTAADSQPMPINTEDTATILLHFSNGSQGSLTLSQISAGRKNYFWWEVFGSQASMRWDQENPNSLWLGYREKPNEIVIKDPALMHEQVRSLAAFPGGHAEGYPDTFFQMFKSFYEPVAAGQPLAPGRTPTFADGHREMILCDAILTSARERRWIKI